MGIYPPHSQPFYGSLDFVWDNPGEPVPEENTHPPTEGKKNNLTSVVPIYPRTSGCWEDFVGTVVVAAAVVLVVVVVVVVAGHNLS